MACGRCRECDGGRGYEWCLHPWGPGMATRCPHCERVVVLSPEAQADGVVECECGRTLTRATSGETP